MFGEWIDLAIRVLIYVDGFGLANHKQFAKFARLSRYQTFPLYGTSIRRENFQSIKNSLNLPSILCVTCQLATVCCSVFCGRNLFLLMIYSYLVHHVSET